MKLNLNRPILLTNRVKLFASKGPAYHFVYGRWRFRRWLNKFQPQRRVTNSRILFANLDSTKPELRAIQNTYWNGEIETAEKDLTIYFRNKSGPLFFFAEDTIRRVVDHIEDDQKDRTVRQANAICQKTFRYRGTTIQFNNEVDWQCQPQGNTDWMWDLNRHVIFNTLGRAYHYTEDDKYLQNFSTLLLDWSVKNPCSVNQANWFSVFEVAMRINNWIWAFFYFREAGSLDNRIFITFLTGLWLHGHYLDTFLELHAQNNHMLLEAKALAMLGFLFPEFRKSSKWHARGWKILAREIRRQVCDDGVHGERTMLYQHIISGELLEFFVLLENNNVAIPDDISHIFEKMVDFEIWSTKPDGLTPLWGDSALSDSALRFSAAAAGPAFIQRPSLKTHVSLLDEASCWLLGPDRVHNYLNMPPVRDGFGSRAFVEGGYFLMRNKSNLDAHYLMFDCGPFGYNLLPTHGHADALSFELYANGCTLLIDPGFYSTHLGNNWRNFFRGSRAHNTVVVDQRDQSELIDIWRVNRPACSTLNHWFSSDHLDLVDGSHDGYERLDRSITHRRQILFVKSEYWLVVDQLFGHGKHRFDLYYHLDPGLSPRVDEIRGVILADNPTGSGLAIVAPFNSEMQTKIITAAKNPIQGWVSRQSGEREPAPVLCFQHEGPAPVQFCTILYPYTSKSPDLITMTPLEMHGRNLPKKTQQIAAVKVEMDNHIDYLIVAPGEKYVNKSFDRFETDAEIIFARYDKGRDQFEKIVLVGATQFRQNSDMVSDMPGETAANLRIIHEELN